MTKLQILSKLDEIYTLVDRHEYADKLREVSKAISSLVIEIQIDLMDEKNPGWRGNRT